MEFIIPAFLAGVLTMLAPCTITLLPIIIGGTVGEKNRWRPLVITLSLGLSIILFSLLLKGTTFLIGVPNYVWRYISGGLITLFGITLVFPSLWDTIAFKLKLYKSEELIGKSNEQGGMKGAVLLGASLGPVFTTCSPTFAIILAIVLPQSFAIGTINLVAFALGLIIPLTLIGYGGQAVAAKFRPAANPRGWLKKTLGILLLLTGLAVFTGFDKTIESFILDSGYLGPIEIEQSLLENVEKPQ
jgi:cytochrome c-type biogenesis protein